MEYFRKNNRRYLLSDKQRPEYRTIEMDYWGDGSFFIEFHVNTTRYLSKDWADLLVEPRSIERIQSTYEPFLSKTGIPEISLTKPYYIIKMDDGTESSYTDRIVIHDISPFLLKKAWSKKEYWMVSQLKYVLEYQCKLPLSIFPILKKKHRKLKHKYLLASQKRKR